MDRVFGMRILIIVVAVSSGSVFECGKNCQRIYWLKGSG